MTVEWVRLAEALAGRFQGLSERERYALFLALQYGRALDGDAGGGADGAPVVRLALFAATGLLVSADADALMRAAFTGKNPGSDEIQAAFFVTRKDRSVGERIARKGSATHVAGVVGRGVVLSFEYPRALFRTVEELWSLCGLWDYDLRIRGLDRGALQRAADESGDAGEAGASLDECLEEAGA